MTINITIAKGAFSVTIQTIEISEDYNNTLSLISQPTTKQKQSTGPKDIKVIDMLKINHTIVVRGVLTNTTDRNNLIKIFEGAEIAGGSATITYDTHPDTPLNMYPEKLTIKENSIDKATNNQRKYEIQITLIEGISI
jgi:hypothetical protein